MTDILRALIFDVDGTLAETEEAHRHAFNQAFGEFGLGWHWDLPLYRRLLTISGGKERMATYALERGTAADPGLLTAVHRRKTELYTARVAAGELELRPGVARLIAEARAAGLELAIATTTSRANVDALLDGATGGAGRAWFSVVACAEDAPVKKPHPQVYLHVLERLGLSAAVCLAVEDSRNGVRAATASGLGVVVSESAYTAGDDFTGALAVWPDLSGVGIGDLRTLRRG